MLISAAIFAYSAVASAAFNCSMDRNVDLFANSSVGCAQFQAPNHTFTAVSIPVNADPMALRVNNRTRAPEAVVLKSDATKLNNTLCYFSHWANSTNTTLYLEFGNTTVTMPMKRLVKELAKRANFGGVVLAADQHQLKAANSTLGVDLFTCGASNRGLVATATSLRQNYRHTHTETVASNLKSTVIKTAAQESATELSSTLSIDAGKGA